MLASRLCPDSHSHPMIARSVVALGVIAIFARQSAAQQTTPETVRGRVTGDSSRAIAGATVIVTRGPDRLTQQTTTDSVGNFRSRFDPGTGDYLVYVSAPGYQSARRRIQRQATERELVADFVLGKAVATLEAIRIAASKPVRAVNPISPTQLETGSSERWNDGVNGQTSPTIAGDLNALAGNMPNVTQTGGGISILGASGESNLFTLNGMGLAAGSIPRAARTETRVTGATYDATRGGFSGANVDVRLGGGNRNYQQRNAFITLNPQAFQNGNPTARALGAVNGGFRGSIGADGELIRKTLTYNVAADFAHNASDPLTLLSADAAALVRAGVSPDSVTRLIALATPLGLPLSGRDVPSNRQHDAFAWLGRLDDIRDTLRTRALTTYFGSTHDGALGFGPLAAPSSAGQQRERTLGSQITLGDYIGPGRNILTETRFAASQVKTTRTPYSNLPGAEILVSSPFAGGSNDVLGLTLGGGSSLAMDDTRWTLEGSNQTAWNAVGRRHHFKALAWARVDGLDEQGGGNSLGTFTFNSLQDFSANHASSFSRTLTQPAKNGSAWNGAVALSQQFAPTRFFSLLYGARLEADGFTSAPAKNAALEEALGVKSGIAPGRLHLSPRIGFSYTYNRDRDNGSGTNTSSVGKFYRTTTGTIRGGVGEFRDLLHPGILADASAATGLQGSTSVLSCVGSATPAVDWAKFENDPGSIPAQCLNGSGPLAESAPSVSLIDPSYDVPRSWRASLGWSTNFKSLLFRFDGLASYDLSQPGIVDANFSGAPRFTLSSEASRPVFVSTSAIDPASGSVSAAESRKSSLFGPVGTRVSDLRGYGGQLTFALSPDVFKFRNNHSLYGSVAYTLQWTRRQFRGFDGADFGDPRAKEWAPGNFDARHVVVISGGFSTQHFGSFTLFGRTQAGLPFTPVVQGDINGDGRGGDRAYIPNPATENDPVLAAGIRSLLATGTSAARDCLSANLGAVAPRNSCRGPWSQSLDVQWRPPMPSKWRGRVIPNVRLENLLSRSQLTPDPLLLVPRGFDATTNNFKYDVNPTFGSMTNGRTLWRNPFRVVIDVAINFAVNYDLQTLRRAVEPVRVPTGWQRRSADSLTAFYLSNTSSIYKLLLEESDSLFLTNGQIKALQSADSLFSARVRNLYIPLGEFLARGSGNAGKAELDSVVATQKAYWKVFWVQPEIAAEILNPLQRNLLPMIPRILSTSKKDRETSQWQFGHPVTFEDKPTPPGFH